MHVRRWGTPGAPKLFMLHGWMDCSATFQFMVDALQQEWDVIAPDWRGFGLSQWQNSSYWFPEYLVDLEALLDHYAPGEPVCVVGHSMGGNAVSMFAGLRPDRVARLANLDAYGTALRGPQGSLERISHWMANKQNGVHLHPGYDSVEVYALRLQKANPRLKPEQAQFLSMHFSRLNEQGRVVPAADPWHRMEHPFVLNAADYKQVWSQITAEVLWVVADDSYLLKRYESCPEEYRARVASFRNLREVMVRDASHNLHHDQPEQLAALVEAFMLNGHSG